MAKTLIADAIIYSSREDVAKLVADVLKMKEVSNIILAQDVTEAMDGLRRFSKALLIVDWAAGAVEATQFLGRNRHDPDSLFRPTLVIADELNDKLVAILAEYGVTHVYAEGLAAKPLSVRIGSLLIVESQPNEVKRALGTAQDRVAAGDLKGALQALLPKLQKYPTNIMLVCEAATLLMDLGQLDAAIKLLTGLENVKPPSIRAMHLLGRCLMKQGKVDEALAAFSSANVFNPYNVERLVDIGNALLTKGDIPEATEKFDRALALDPEMAEAGAGMAKCKLMDGDVNQALTFFRDTTTDAEKAAVFNTCAILSMRSGQHEKGMNLYRSALAVLGKNQSLAARLHFNMGMGYRRSGDRSSALKEFDIAQQMDPKFDKAAKQISELRGAAASQVPATAVSIIDDDLLGDSMLDETLNTSVFQRK